MLLIIFRIPEEEFHKHRKLMLSHQIVQALLAKIGLMTMGIWSVKRVKLNLDLSRFPKLKKVENANSRIICSNHVSFLDIIIYFSQMSASFITKSEIENVPILGTNAKAL